MIPINRDNLSSAIDSLNTARDVILNEGHNVAIAVEGTRRRKRSVDHSDYRQNLMEFKKGPFHLAKNSCCTVVPVIVFGANRLCPPKSVIFNQGI